jgi:dephospho-CoA kinase
VILVGLTGGIGAGKSTVSSMLAERGAVIVDADAIVRELQAPGAPVFAAMVDRFGPTIVADDGTLDRAAVAAVVFNDPEALKDLNAIVHPAVNTEIRQRIQAELAGDRIVVLDIPLLVEGVKDGKPRYPVSAVIVVDTPVEVAVERLVRFRGLGEDDARARIGRQVSREQRLALADRVVDNAGSPEALAPQIDELWVWLSALPAADPAALAS